MKKALSIFLSLVMLLSVTGLCFESSAMSNPYPGNMNSNCTYAAWQKTKDILGIELPGWGNAWTWYSSAQSAGYSVGSTPQANSIVVFKQASWNGNYGHVAFVTEYNSSTGQIYKLEGNYNGTYHEGWAPAYESDMYGYIYLSGGSATPSGSPIGGGAQTVSDGEYHIVSALNRNMGLDAEDGKTANDTNICLYNNIEDSAQTFIVKYLGDGFYSIIHKKSQKSLDVNMASTANGTNVKLYTYSGNDAQRWVLQTSGDGYFYIKSKCNGFCVDVANASTANKTNIQMYSGNDTNAQKWAFIATNGTQSVPNGNYHIVSALNNNYGLDVYGCENKNGTNVQLYNNKGDTNQVFNINYDKKGYYTITHNKTNKVLDMYNNGTYFGTNVNIYAANGTDAQKWIIKSDGKGYYYIIAKNSGLFIDVKDGKAENYNNVWGYIGNGSNAQKWKFVCSTHAWNSGVTTKKATCTTAGTKQYTCTVCGEKKTETIQATGHTVVIDQAVAPTFEKAGKTEGKHCKVCDKVLVAQKTVAKLGAPALSKVTAGKKQFKATWKSVANIDGYQVQYATGAKFSGAKTVTVKGYKSTATTVKKLKGKKKYYVRIRAYKKINGKKQHSAWSKAKTVTTKK